MMENKFCGLVAFHWSEIVIGSVIRAKEKPEYMNKEGGHFLIYSGAGAVNGSGRFTQGHRLLNIAGS